MDKDNSHKNIGVIGHVDHGKTTLVTALTSILGRDKSAVVKVEEDVVKKLEDEQLKELDDMMTLPESESFTMTNLHPLPRLRHKGVPYKAEEKPGRNELCHCGSGKKYKKCHLQKDIP